MAEEPTFEIGEIAYIAYLGSWLGTRPSIGTEVEITSIRATWRVCNYIVEDGYKCNIWGRPAIVEHASLKRKDKPEFERGSWKELRSIWNPFKESA